MEDFRNFNRNKKDIPAGFGQVQTEGNNVEYLHYPNSKEHKSVSGNIPITYCFSFLSFFPW